VSFCLETNPVTKLKMSATLNPVYKTIRELGFSYEIKESGGSVIIKIESLVKPQLFNNSKEKFQFQTTRTLNGSENRNWRSPQNYEKNSYLPRKSFPDINFFQSTPPPSYKTPPHLPLQQPVLLCVLQCVQMAQTKP
jgi:hypothetical protein